MTTPNPLGLDGIVAVAWSAPDAAGTDAFAHLFAAMGFSRTRQRGDVDLWEQHDIRLLVDRTDGFARAFAAAHGPCLPYMAWGFRDPAAAFAEAVRRGARPFEGRISAFGDAPAVYGIGDSLIVFVTTDGAWERPYTRHAAALTVPERGFRLVDHLTNNVHKGTMAAWKRFYQDVFGFTEVRYFDIKGEKTGLTSHALRSPCGRFAIPINEGNEAKSQIEEYLREYRGPGVQHLAFLTDDLLRSLDGLTETGVQTLDIDPIYYRDVFTRVPGVREDHAGIEKLQVLVDGDDEGYLLQIFTQNVVGPIFFEFIQRENHLSFGAGNFGALFRSIERDQERRGVL